MYVITNNNIHTIASLLLSVGHYNVLDVLTQSMTVGMQKYNAELVE